MSKIWLVANVNSGSYEEGLCERLSEAFSRHGHDLDNSIQCPEDDLPDAAALDAAGVDCLAVFGGDGTVSSAMTQATGWNGDLLVLPGGTMNLLSIKLHGDVPPVDIAERYARGDYESRRIGVAKGEDQIALVGVIVGPTTALGEVREDMRHLKIADMAADIAAAWRETFSGNPVSVAGSDREYPAMFIEPGETQLHLSGFTADGIGQVLQHGLAWATGDFREGPHEDLGTMKQVTLGSDAPQLGLLVDGEEAECGASCTFVHGHAPVKFAVTKDFAGTDNA